MLFFKNLRGFFNFIDGRNQIYYNSDSSIAGKVNNLKIKERPGRDLNPSPKLDRRFYKEKIRTNNDNLLTYLSLCKINGISNGWLEQINRMLAHYLEYVEWEIDEDNTINYLEHIIDSNSVSYFRKRVYQIRKYLTYLNIEWANNINPPNEPIYYPKRIKNDDIKNTLEYFAENPYYKQIRAIIYLGMTTGMRAEELYQLKIKDVDLDNRMVYINHNPSIGQTTKTKISRKSFFTNEAKEIFEDYLTYFNNERILKRLFSKKHIIRLFSKSPIKVKDLRKHFSQEWDRHGGPTSIKKILMGHSLKGDVDLMHYNYQSEEDLKSIYDKVMDNNVCDNV